MQGFKRQSLARGAVVGGWLLVTALLALWLVEAIHRGHLASILIVAVTLAGIVLVPLMAARLRS